jgi:ubiquinone/menaquinone biosynthesis C-methylase UbiE
MQTIDFQRLGLSPGDRVLDLGCGEGRHAINAYICEEVESVGVDLSPEDIATAIEKSQNFLDPENCNKSLTLTVADALDLPFADNHFDKVICSEVLEHIPDYLGALEEVRRVLKPGGVFAASVPRFGPEWLCWALSDEYHANDGGHLRIFKAQSLRREIERLGMTYFRGHFAHALHAPFWWLKCLLWKAQESSRLIKAYHQFLVWDLMERPWLTRALERLLNPLIGKSVIMYFRKGDVS